MEDLFKPLPLRKLGRGQLLIYEGDPVDKIYCLVSGYVKVSNILIDGTQRTIFVYGPADIFPLTSYLSGLGVARYFYECMTDVEIKVMPQARFQERIRGDYELGEQLIEYTYKLNIQFAERIETLTEHSARQKIAALLVFLAERTNCAGNKKVRLDIPLTSQDMADMCNLTRETASIQLQRLKKTGAVQGGRHLLIDREKLMKILAS